MVAERTLPGRDAAIRAVRSGATALRRINAGRRPLPGFVILGAQKAGTTSLHEYLCEHPLASSSTVKEVHYFDLAYERGPAWYRAHFQIPRRADEIAGEASPYYLFHPLVPARVARDLPEARLIVLLRNPIERAYSHHNHERALGFEKLGFVEAIECEPERLRGEEERLAGERGYRSFAHQHHGYLARGRYADQLERWLAHVEREADPRSARRSSSSSQPRPSPSPSASSAWSPRCRRTSPPATRAPTRRSRTTFAGACARSSRRTTSGSMSCWAGTSAGIEPYAPD